MRFPIVSNVNYRSLLQRIAGSIRKQYFSDIGGVLDVL